MTSVASAVALVVLLSVNQVCLAHGGAAAEDARDLVLALSAWTRQPASQASDGLQHRHDNGGSSSTATALPSTESVDRLIVDCCGVCGINPNLMRALIRAESAFRHDAISRAGAIGLCQLMPSTARELGVNPWNPAENVAGGTQYLRSLLTEFGSPVDALIGYNAGPQVVRAREGIPAETVRYVRNVLRFFVEYEGDCTQGG